MGWGEGSVRVRRLLLLGHLHVFTPPGCFYLLAIKSSSCQLPDIRTGVPCHYPQSLTSRSPIRTVFIPLHLLTLPPLPRCPPRRTLSSQVDQLSQITFGSSFALAGAQPLPGFELRQGQAQAAQQPRPGAPIFANHSKEPAGSFNSVGGAVVLRFSFALVRVRTHSPSVQNCTAGGGLVQKSNLITDPTSVHASSVPLLIFFHTSFSDAERRPPARQASRRPLR